jgi:hypothetical protein
MISNKEIILTDSNIVEVLLTIEQQQPKTTIILHLIDNYKVNNRKAYIEIYKTNKRYKNDYIRNLKLTLLNPTKEIVNTTFSYFQNNLDNWLLNNINKKFKTNLNIRNFC